MTTTVSPGAHMHSQICRFTQTLLLSCSLTGCTILSLPPTISKVQDHFTETASPRPQLVNSTGLTPTEVGQLQCDQYCELRVASPDNSAETGSDDTTIAGRVAAIDETHLVLTEAVRIHRDQIQVQSKSRLRKVPYVSRLLKRTTSAYVPPVSIPGEVRVRRSEVQQASTIPSEQWATFRQDGIVRIGIDFDFNVR
ncbi:MAG: hypothetical protein JWP89_2512 [Schlesneria sp.]|nr:hypothetical protein [Schlesneria sp.]